MNVVARLRAVPGPPKPLLIAVAIVALIAVGVGFEILRLGGAFHSVKPEFAGNCRAIEIGGSVRDIRIDRERGVGYLSFLDRDTGNGTVVLLDLNLADPTPRAATSRDPQGFHPEGISLLKQVGEPARLFAVSRVEGGVSAVEFLEQNSSGAFVPKATARDALFGAPSLVASVGPSVIYTVDHHAPAGGFRQKLSLLTKSGDDAIVLHDAANTKSVVVAQGLAWMSGLSLSPDGSHLYAAETLKRRLLVFRVEGAGGERLILERTVALGTPPAGLDVDSDGVLWIATYPKLLTYFSALDDRRLPVPTEVLRFDPRQPDAGAVAMFADDGARISGGTIAAHWRDELLIGAPLDDKVLLCKQNP